MAISGSSSAAGRGTVIICPHKSIQFFDALEIHVQLALTCPDPLTASVYNPTLNRVTEDGKYCLTLVFEAKSLELSDFEKRQAKFTLFFGPGITAEIGTGDKVIYEVRLISNTKP